MITSILVQEETRLQIQKAHSFHLQSHQETKTNSKENVEETRRKFTQTD